MDNKNIRSQIEQKAKSLKKRAGIFLSNYIQIEGNARERREAVNLRLNQAAKGIALGFMAFFFGKAEFVFAVYPLGSAMLCAAVKYVPFIYIGLIISTLFTVGMASPMFITYTLALLVRFTLSYMTKKEYTSSLFGEKKLYRVLLSSLMMLFCGVIACVRGGFLWFDFFGLIFGVILAPMLTLLFSGAFEERHRFTAFYDAALCGVMSFLVYALRDATLFGFSLSCIAAFGLTLYISKECGMLRGGAVGLFVGMAYNVFYSPLFAIAGLISGLFWKMGSVYATACALGAGILYSVYLNGFSALTTLAPDLLAASLIFTPMAHLGLLPKPRIYTGKGSFEENKSDITAVKEKQNDGVHMRIRAMSESLSGLASVFYNLSCAEKKPCAEDIGKTVESCFDAHCKSCPRYRICWDQSYRETAAVVKEISMRIYDGNIVEYGDIPKEFSKKCNRMNSIIADINKGYSQQLKSALEGSKAEVFAIDYAAMSTLLTQALNENSKEYEIDEELTPKVKGCAKYLNLYSSNLCVYGKRQKRIIAGGIDLARVRLGVDEIRRSFEKVTGIPFCAPVFAIEGENVTMTLERARAFKAEYAHMSLKKEREDINGDSVNFFENNQDYFYSMISDGMGSGRDAALCSRLSGIYLDKMLRAGNKKAQSLEMLNSFLRQKNIECSTTVDLLEIDLLNGEASFVKSGAAPSYVLRGTSVFKISSNTMPVGIAKELLAEEVKFELQDRDIVVMTSDGICASFEDGVWLMDMLANEWARGVSLNEMCEKVLDRARELNGEKDDMTVGMVKISKIH